MGKSCVRFKKIDDVPLKVIGQVIKRIPAKKFIAQYESILASMSRRSGKASPRKAGAKQAGASGAAGKTAGRSAKKHSAKTVSKRKA